MKPRLRLLLFLGIAALCARPAQAQSGWFDGNMSPSTFTICPVIGGVADFNADGKPDLFWRNAATGQNLIWYMNGAAYVSYAWVDTLADTDWKAAMVADFNKPDVLWRNSVTGENIIWYLNGSAYVSYAWVLTNADANWKIGQHQ